MTEKVFWLTCKYSADGRCSIKIVDERLGDDVFTENGKKIPNRLYASLSAVPTDRRLKTMEYIGMDSEEHTIYEVSQQGFYYDSENDDLAEVARAKKRIAVAVVRPCMRAVAEQRQRLDETETTLENLVAEVGRI